MFILRNRFRSSSGAAVNRLLLVLLCLPLAGCVESGPAADLDDYLTRLERVLEQGSHQIAETDFPRLPDVRDLRLVPAEDNIDILEFLRIGRCELQQLVAERNSNLGRLAEPSQRLVYEINFLRLGDACLAAIADDYPDLAAELAAVLETKRRDLPIAIWQATLGGDEFRALFSPGSEALPEAFEEDSELLLAFQQLETDIERWLAGNYAIDSGRLERQLDLIRRGDMGKQLRAWSLLDNKLSQASRVVADRLRRRPLCYQGMQTPKADILDSVIREYFVGRVQAWAAGLNARYYEQFPAIRALELTLTVVEPEAYRRWRIERDVFLEQARPALANHVEALRPLLEQCSILPGADNTVAMR